MEAIARRLPEAKKRELDLDATIELELIAVVLCLLPLAHAQA